MGEKRIYQKLKKDSVCYNDRSYKAQENAATCPCTQYDYKCDFGYKRSQGMISKIWEFYNEIFSKNYFL